MTNSTVLAIDLADSWTGFWRGNLGVWVLDRGVRITLLLIGGLLTARLINGSPKRIAPGRFHAQYTESDQLVLLREHRTDRPSHR